MKSMRQIQARELGTTLVIKTGPDQTFRQYKYWSSVPDTGLAFAELTAEEKGEEYANELVLGLWVANEYIDWQEHREGEYYTYLPINSNPTREPTRG